VVPGWLTSDSSRVNGFQDLPHVLAGQLHDERDHPGIRLVDDVPEMMLSDETVVVAGLPAAKNVLLYGGQRFPGGMRSVE
jgi:hypothetical protein